MAYKEKDTKKWTAQWFETKREALEYERQKKLNNSRSMDMKLSEFMEVYFEDKQNELKERTMKNKRYMMEQHIIPYFGNQMMSEITAGQIIQWQNEMQTKGFSEAYLLNAIFLLPEMTQSHQNKISISAESFLQCAVNYGTLFSCITSSMKYDGSVTQKKQQEVLTRQSKLLLPYTAIRISIRYDHAYDTSFYNLLQAESDNSFRPSVV